MSFFLKFIIIVIVLSCFMPSLMAQTPEPGGVSIIKDEFKFPSLEVVIDSVLKRSAMVSFRKNSIAVKESTLATERIYWSKNLGVQADTRYGNLSNFATSEDGVSNTAALTTSKQFNYSVGFFVKYQDLILKQKILQIKSRSLGDGRVNMQMVEKEFRNGIVPIAEYVRIVGMTENMEADYTKAMSEFITAKLLLEDMAGFEFGLTRLN